jgi:hypothetical protein
MHNSDAVKTPVRADRMGYPTRERITNKGDTDRKKFH